MSNRPFPYLFWWILIAVAFCSLPLLAAPVDEPLADIQEEQRAQALFGELRCVVCAGQSLADSNATLAVQMRAHVRGMVEQGQSDAEVLQYFTETYGPSVRMAPPFAGFAAIIWLTPGILLLVGILILWQLSRKRRGA